MPALAKKAILSDITVSNTEEDLIVSFKVDDCFTTEMNRAIESGIDTTFTFFIKLYEEQGFLWDKQVADLEISHSIKYDNLKKHYELRLSGNGDKAVIVKDFDKAKKLMADVVALKVTSISNLQKGMSYQLWMMAELDKIRLPFYLHYVFFFLSLWDFETDWYINDFIY
ncbi:MAG: DUF4390 domain-containing protein [Deltaproteobacteria bacterium]|nr:DUF4390 domain-containing protein [Deltaproteobacteria bacterium]MBW1916155.1 DUF4390 domain-containing protein [Deltaproteobacteria bacterium]